MDLEAACAVISRDRDEAEDTTRMTPAVHEAAADAGLWVLAAPREVGGGEQTLVELVDTFEALGHADAAFAWIAMNSMFTCHVAARLPAEVRAEVFASTDAPYGLGGAIGYAAPRRVDGGWRIDGDWQFMTGAADARWATVNVLADGRDLYHAVICFDDLTVSDTWRSATSMRGTGSHAVRGVDVFVPDERAVSGGAALVIDRPLFRVAGNIVIWAPCAALVIGALRSAIDGMVALAGPKLSSGSPNRAPHASGWRVQQAVCDATAAAECLRAGLRHVTQELWECAEADEALSLQLRARWWSLLFATFDVARHHASELYSRSTSGVYAGRNRVERALRDIHAIATTFEQVSAQGLRGAAGRVLLGLDPENPGF